MSRALSLRPPRSLLSMACAVLAVLAAATPTRAQNTAPSTGPVVVGSKAFTESVVLGEVAARVLEAEGVSTVHRRELGGTRFVWSALLAGDVDLYPEYTGTLLQEIYAGRELSPDGLAQALREDGVGMTAPLGFDNTYALGMKRELADSLEIRTISDLAGHDELTLAFSNEFMDRPDGWPGLRDAYALPHSNVRGLTHDLAYRGLDAGSIDVMDLYSTDAEIAYYDLRVLEDDLGFFPEYRAVILYRLDVPPAAVDALERLEGRIDEAAMIAMNASAKIDRTPETRIAARFAEAELGLEPAPARAPPGPADRIWLRTKEHLFLVAVSLSAAVATAIPLGIAAAKIGALEQVILGVVGVIYTIPSLALLVLMIPLLGIGGPPAILALFLYSLLPIVRNTHAGLKGIPPDLVESADALGLSPASKLRLVELPLASRSILAGIKTSTVINIGTATLGALIGAGGYGQPILTGIRLDDMGLILEGAVPAAVLALVAQGLFEAVERIALPRGLRI